MEDIRHRVRSDGDLQEAKRGPRGEGEKITKLFTSAAGKAAEVGRPHSTFPWQF